MFGLATISPHKSEAVRHFLGLLAELALLVRAAQRGELLKRVTPVADSGDILCMEVQANLFKMALEAVVQPPYWEHGDLNQTHVTQQTSLMSTQGQGITRSSGSCLNDRRSCSSKYLDLVSANQIIPIKWHVLITLADQLRHQPKKGI